MFDLIKQNVLIPVGQRLGTLVAGVLLPYGVHSESAEMVTVGLLGVGLVALDLIAARISRNRGGE